MKTAAAILTAIFVVTGCQPSAEQEKKMTELQTQNKQLYQEISSRDEYIESVTQAVNNVYKNIESVRSKETALLHQTNEMETKKLLSNQEVRANLLHEISTIDSNLKDNQKTLVSLQSKINTYRTQYAGLKVMVANLNQTIHEREASIADLQQRVERLETAIGEKAKLITQRDSVIEEQTTTIDAQKTRINTAFYVIGTRSDLEEKGIIKKEGGFLWGLLGSTTVLSNGFDSHFFNPIDKLSDTTIQIVGTIDELVPKRDMKYYHKTEIDRDRTRLAITEPGSFWQDNYLVIITD
jgi:peptidoglycan hydrolase CwlO-like protein